MNVELDDVCVLTPELKGTEWLGGVHYYRNLQTVVQSRVPELEFAGYDPRFRPKVNETFTSRVIRKLTGKKIADDLHQAARNYFSTLTKRSVPVIFSNAPVRYSGGVGTIYWIPDFQFLHLPQLANAAHVDAAAKEIRNGAEYATLIMVSSEDARKDLESFAPHLVNKARVVRFAKKIEEQWLGDTAYIRAKYNLPRKFFYVPNQFWKHKNHKVILEAITHLKRGKPDVTIVFSGNIHDFRSPDYFNELLTYVAEQGIREHVIFLGVIPFPDVVSLYRESVAVINASLFEGWSTTVEEVKSIGKPLILSDIAVHKEQAEGIADFFERHSAFDLSVKLGNAWQKDPGVNLAAEENARKNSIQREIEFATNFKLLVEEAVVLARNKS